MALPGNEGGGAKNLARAQRKPGKVKPKPQAPPSFPKQVPVRPGARTPKPRKVKPKPQAPPSFPKQVPVRPGARTPRPGKSPRPGGRPSTQAERTHVHKARVKRGREIKRARAQERQYRSQGEAVEKAAAQQRVPKGLPKSQADLYLTDPKALKKAGFKAPGVLDKIAQAPGAFIANTAKDTAELAATTPTSTYMLGKTAVTEPKKLPGMLIEPYKQLAKDPAKFVFEHPVSTALMVTPAGRLPGRAAGKALRVAGRQTLEGVPKELPGTALKEPVARSRSAVLNARQARYDRQHGPRKVTADEVRRRVDEAFDVQRKHTQRVEVAKAREIKPQVKQLPKAERKGFKAEQVKGALGGARTQNDRAFVREFGSTWQVGHKGAVLKPKRATEGHLHPSRADAEKVAQRLGKAGHGEFVVKQVTDNEYGVIPKVAAEQLRLHEGVGTSRATGARVLRATRTKFTNTVLPLSPKWLTGQAVEGTLRAAVQGAGPTSWLRERRVFKELERQHPGAGKAFRERGLAGGQYGGQVQEFRTQRLHETFNQGGAEGQLGRALARIGQASEKGASKPGVKQTLGLWNRYTNLVFDRINGRGIEQHVQRAMLGRQIKTDLLDRKLVGLSNKAVAEATRGLKGTDTQVRMARGVQRAYGKYSSFNPHQREFQLHWAPFLPWYRNAVQFLASVLPKDHPALTALLATGNVATQEERKKLGLSQYADQKSVRPGFLQGGIPVKGGGVIRVGHYTPFAIGEARPSESVRGIVLPQLQSAHAALGGLDWKGDPIRRGGEATRWENALAAQIQALVPGTGQAARITGLAGTLTGKKGARVSLGPADLKAAAVKEFHPFRPTNTPARKPKRKARRKRGQGWDSSPWSSQSSGGGWGP